MPQVDRARSRSRQRDYKRRSRSSSRRRPVATPPRSQSSQGDDMSNRWNRDSNRRQDEEGNRAELRPNRWNRDSGRGEDAHGGNHSSSWEKPASNYASEGWGGGSSGGSAQSRDSSRQPLKPLPRPGFDQDQRLAALNDDPRYAEGADLGKAQKAAMGIKGLSGRNTASFDPRSTLVRPAMRVIYGRQGKRYGQETKPDDVVVVPELFCTANDATVVDLLAQELKQFKASGAEGDPAELPVVSRLLAKMVKYFSVEWETCAARVRWYRKAGAEPIDYESPGYKKKKGRNCTLNLSLGATCELAFKRSKTKEVLYFPQANGTLLLIGRDVSSSWHTGEESKAPDGLHISISVVGNSSQAVEEDVLAVSVAAATKEGPCRDFRFGRCNYGDNCKFSHGDAAEEPAKTTEDLAPISWPARPTMRVITLPPSEQYAAPVKHDDVIVVPEFFCAEEDWDIYYTLIKEMREAQAKGERKSDWISWHEGAHLLSQNPTGSKTYHKIVQRIGEYFNAAENNRGTRFNWYRDGSDWKPFHHDSAAFNADRAKNQNCTIGISFGASRELAFRHAKTGELIYFPQKNGMLFYFGRDANIIWQHGINALPEKEQDGKGRISIILWCLCQLGVEEAGSPGMLTDDSRGSYSMHGKGGKGKGKGKSDGVCRDFQRGTCTYGNKCRFSHTG